MSITKKGAPRRLVGLLAATAITAGVGAAIAAPAAQAYPVAGGFNCQSGTDGQVPRYKTECTDSAGNHWVYKYPNDGVTPWTATRTGPAGSCYAVNAPNGPYEGTCGGPVINN